MKARAAIIPKASENGRIKYPPPNSPKTDWIPAFAGMTERGAGMTKCGVGMTGCNQQGHVTVIVIFVLAWVFWGTGGCQNRSGQPPAGRVVLPPDITGTWKAEDSPWQIVLSRDGSVTSAVIPLGEVEVRPNKTTKVEMADGNYSTYKAGDCIVEYIPNTRELFVSVEMEKIHVVYTDNIIDGNSIDRFVGPVSEDGKTWAADWINIFDYGPRFPQDANDIFAEPLIFRKVKN